ncbi:HNH endonuclease [Methylobacterium durans]|uniref:HNH endonuclease n=1 Tax=Methylobacterium durans TaxID=2202825 RepID=A0A2U8WBM7_9HYPH|nr:HNH endonuclease signature motif containing protein [Methylobacterium durans]AWN43483.1 HNH endonuclease [Methylobacterium durans]
MARLTMLRPRLNTISTRLKVTRGTEPGQAFYSTPEWRALRDRLLRERGRKCEDCGRTGTRIYCDHVEEISDGGAPLDEANVRLRCGSCHTTKTADARARRHGLR